MEKLIEILEEICPEADCRNCNSLIDDEYLDSMAILALVTELEDEFDVTIPAVEIIPDNFNSAEALWTLIVRLQEEG